MSAKIRHTFAFFMILLTILSLLFFLAVLVLNGFGWVPLTILSDSVAFPGFVISAGACLLIPLWARILFAAKDELLYDEFGVKKIDKHYMDSRLRNQIEAEKIAEMERTLSKETVKRITHQSPDKPDQELQKLIGLTNVKEKVSDLEAKLEFIRSSGKKRLQEKESYHMVFLGNPGTGKTTVARILTGILYENYCIDQDKILEVDGNFLKGRDAKETAVKTKALIRASYGGVLFIDEAYALMYDPAVGEIAIATLIKEMEDHRDKFTLILAGYSEEMKELISFNPGFASRIRDYYYFEDYDNEEAYQIFSAFLKTKGFTASDTVKERLFERIDKERELSSWGNGRTMRNLATEAIEKHMVRYMHEKLPKTERYQISEEDICVDVKNNVINM